MSLLNLQAGQTGDLAALGVLRESQNRVRSMSLVHETLYQSENLARIDMRDYQQFPVRCLGVVLMVERLSLSGFTESMMAWLPRNRGCAG